jgi:hypothetical protein
VRHGADEIVDIEQGADLGRLLPLKLAQLVHPLDGSFCERLIHHEPNDVDLVTFFAKPPGVDLRALIAANRWMFSSKLTRMQHLCDAYFVQLHDGKFAEPGVVSYWYSLFSHRRDDSPGRVYSRYPLALPTTPTRSTP